MRAVVAMSGGVDSCVAALELKKKGYEVLGITIKTWPKDECGQTGEKLCCSLDAIQYARSAAEDIGIPYYVVDYSAEFSEIVKKYFIEEYVKGRTPNPCIFCNSKIKFGYLFQKARELGAERIATGHYARIIEKDGSHYLFEAKDTHQDQSYFLCDISKKELPYIDFPLGAMTKDEVREIAVDNGFMSAERGSSQDICFVTANGGGYREYLADSGVNVFSVGDILDTEGKVIGKHNGIACYTVGQRKGLGIALGKPAYVVKIDPENNSITVGEKEHAMNKKIRVSGFNWLVPDGIVDEDDVHVRIRYNSEKVKARLLPEGSDAAVLEFEEPQFAVTPGQAAVFYKDGMVAGGSWIKEIIE